MIKNIVLIATGLFLVACVDQQEASDEKQTSGKSNTKTEKSENEEQDTLSSASIESIIADIDDYRNKVEQKLENPIELKTEDLREKIKQKWEKIHFYTHEDEVVRIKAYPYDMISNRTEEFYLEDGELILAVIEDDGSNERSKEDSEIDKLYYFNNEKVISEISREGEPEYSVRDSDGEELLSEVNEYIKLFEEHIKKGA